MICGYLGLVPSWRRVKKDDEDGQKQKRDRILEQRRHLFAVVYSEPEENIVRDAGLYAYARFVPLEGMEYFDM